MRVGLVIYDSLETLTGGYLYDRMLVEHLQECGDQVELISLPGRSYGRHLADNFSTTLLKRLCQTSLDVLLQDELNHPSLFWLNHRLRRREFAPIITIVHHLRSSEPRPAWQNWFYRFVERIYLDSVDAVVCNSQTTRRAVESLIGRSPRATVAYPAGDRLHPEIGLMGVRARARASGPLQLLFVGSVIPRKGLHVLLSALHSLPRSMWRLTVAGNLEMDPTYSESIRRRVENRTIEKQIAYLGSVGEARLAHLMQTHHLLVVPSFYEGFGIVYLEGMGFGLPAIAGDAGAAGEIIQHGKNGFLVPTGDSHVLAAHLRELYRDRGKLEAMSLVARERYCSHPTWKQTTAQIRHFMQNGFGIWVLTLKTRVMRADSNQPCGYTLHEVEQSRLKEWTDVASNPTQRNSYPWIDHSVDPSGIAEHRDLSIPWQHRCPVHFERAWVFGSPGRLAASA